MLGLHILLFWLPVVGPFIAGLVGGRKAGSVGSAITAAILPAVGISALVFVIGAAFGLPLVSAAVGAILLVVLAVEFFPLIIGAIVGGALAE
jgi:hypothetical protein